MRRPSSDKPPPSMTPRRIASAVRSVPAGYVRSKLTCASSFRSASDYAVLESRHVGCHPSPGVNHCKRDIGPGSDCFVLAERREPDNILAFDGETPPRRHGTAAKQYQ